MRRIEAHAALQPADRGRLVQPRLGLHLLEAQVGQQALRRLLSRVGRQALLEQRDRIVEIALPGQHRCVFELVAFLQLRRGLHLAVADRTARQREAGVLADVVALDPFALESPQRIGRLGMLRLDGQHTEIELHRAVDITAPGRLCRSRQAFGHRRVDLALDVVRALAVGGDIRPQHDEHVPGDRSVGQAPLAREGQRTFALALFERGMRRCGCHGRQRGPHGFSRSFGRRRAHATKHRCARRQQTQRLHDTPGHGLPIARWVCSFALKSSSSWSP